MLLVLLACNTDVQVAAQSDPALLSAQERLGLTDAEVKQILAFLNRCDTTFDLLDSVVGLDSDAAEHLVNTRDGADAECGTNDDGTYLTLDAVDAVPQVGDKTILEVLAYLDEGADGDGTWEGVTFTAEEQVVVLEIANKPARRCWTRAWGWRAMRPRTSSTPAPSIRWASWRTWRRSGSPRCRS